MKLWIVRLVAALFVVGSVQVAVAQGQGQGQGQGQVVSECNHRANERKLMGHERKDFVEWCESRGARYKYDDKRYEGEKNCYQKANNKGLTGDKRAKFLDKCFGKDGDDYYGGKVPVKKKD